MDENTIVITTDEGEEKTYNILLTFESQDFNKSYVLFYDPEFEDDIYTASFDDQNNLFAVETDEEIAMINEVLEVYNDEQEKEEI